MTRPILLIVLLALLASCSSGNTALRRGRYDLAVQRASHRLTQHPGWSKRGHVLAPLVLKAAFARAYEQRQNAIRQLSASTEPFRWERVHAEYEKLETLTANAAKCQNCADWLSTYPVSYADRQTETRRLAAADRYDVAEQAFAWREENRLAAKEAYLNYQKANDWVADFRQAGAKAQDALPFAILRVVVEPLSPTSEISASDNAELQGLIFRQIGRQDAPSAFVRLYPPDENAGNGYAIHQAVQMQVTDYSGYNENTSSSCTTVYSNQEYKVGEKKINDSTKVDIMEKVKGTLTTFRREITAGLTLRMRGIDTQTGQELWQEPVWESRSWVTEWQTFSGDDRALNGGSLKTADPFAPSRWSLYDSMRDELARDVARRLRNRYAHD